MPVSFKNRHFVDKQKGVVKTKKCIELRRSTQASRVFGDRSARESSANHSRWKKLVPPAIDTVSYRDHDCLCEHPTCVGCEGAHSTGRSSFG